MPIKRPRVQGYRRARFVGCRNPLGCIVAMSDSGQVEEKRQAPIENCRARKFPTPPVRCGSFDRTVSSEPLRGGRGDLSLWDFNISTTVRGERIARNGGHLGWVGAVISLSMLWARWQVGFAYSESPFRSTRPWFRSVSDIRGEEDRNRIAIIRKNRHRQSPWARKCAFGSRVERRLTAPR